MTTDNRSMLTLHKEEGGGPGRVGSQTAMTGYIRATDLLSLSQCDRQVFLDHHGDPRQRLDPSAYDRWLADQGRDFERQVAATFRVEEPRFAPDRLEDAFEDTLDLMREGVAWIYHGVLIDGELLGIPDLLQRVEGASQCGSYYYRPVDVKLAHEAKPEHQLQVMFYIRLLEAIQGRRPDGSLLLRLPVEERTEQTLYREVRVVLDDESFTVAMRELMRLAGGDEPRPFISSVCKGCRWRAVCVPIAERDQDVSLIPGLQRRVWQALHGRGLGTLSATAAATPQQLLDIKGVGTKTAQDIVLRAQALTDGRHIRVSAPTLSDPSDGEVFFDVESYPPADAYYLLGTLVRRDERHSFVYELARQPEEEEQIWQSFLQRIDQLDGPVYHYGTFERTAVTTLARRYGDDTRAQGLLNRMVDLEKVLKACVALPLRGYSLKDVAHWLDFEWSGETQAADESMLEYDAWLRTGRQAHLNHILRYNEDDLRATATVRDWLLSLR